LAIGRDLVQSGPYLSREARPTVGLSILARDEADTIVDAISSCEGVVSDVCVLVDTRSQDGSASAARSAGARVELLDQWPGMAGARNRLIELARTDWVLVLDGHERLSTSGRETLRRGIESGALEQIGERTSVVSLLLALSEREGGAVAPVPRLHRREGVRYLWDVHPLPTVEGALPEGVLWSGVELLHDDPGSSAAAYRDRQKERFNRLLSEYDSGAASTPGATARRAPLVVEAAHSSGRHELASLLGLGWLEVHGRAASQHRAAYVAELVARSFLLAGQQDKARELANGWAVLAPGRAGLMILQGDCALVLGRSDTASVLYQAAAGIKPPQWGWYRTPDYRWRPYTRLAGLAVREDRWADCQDLVGLAQSSSEDAHIKRKLDVLAGQVASRHPGLGDALVAF